ncbi:hypothetical protein Y032_0125g1301 [Ancylostoma ceylanicum]|nr:hypothetical protein Y032_0125g1301 [Ancylostoma ceylanicum]
MKHEKVKKSPNWEEKRPEIALRRLTTTISARAARNTIPSRQVQTSPGNQIQPPPLIDLSEDLSTTNPIHAVPTQPKVLQLPPTGSIPGPSTGYGWSVPTTEAHQAPEQAAPIPLHPTNPFLQDLSVPQPSGSTPY